MDEITKESKNKREIKKRRKSSFFGERKQSGRKFSILSWESFKTAFTRRASSKNESINLGQIDAVTVRSIRTLLLNQFKDHCDSNNIQFHPNDIKKIEISDTYIQRFIDYAWMYKTGTEYVTDQKVIDLILPVSIHSSLCNASTFKIPLFSVGFEMA